MVMASAEDEVEGRLELLWPTGLSVVEEAMDQGQALWSAGWARASAARTAANAPAEVDDDLATVTGWPD